MNINADNVTDLFVPQLLDNMVDTCHCCHCCWYCVSLLHVWSQVLLSVASHFHHVLFIWRPSNVKPKPPHTQRTLSTAFASSPAREGGEHFDRVLLRHRLRRDSIFCLHFYCLSLSLWLFSIMLNKGAQLKPLPAVEPDTHICHCSHTYWRYKAMKQ